MLRFCSCCHLELQCFSNSQKKKGNSSSVEEATRGSRVPWLPFNQVSDGQHNWTPLWAASKRESPEPYHCVSPRCLTVGMPVFPLVLLASLLVLPGPFASSSDHQAQPCDSDRLVSPQVQVPISYVWRSLSYWRRTQWIRSLQLI